MNRTATAALEEADVVVLVVEALKWTAEDDLALERIVRSGRAAIAAVNKVDRVRPRERLLPYLGSLGDAPSLPRRRAGLGAEVRQRRGPAHAPSPRTCRSAPALFPDGELTDRGLEFRIAEMIREKLTLELNQEVPYGIAVEVERLAERGRAADGRCGHLGRPRGPEADRDRRQGRAAEARRAPPRASRSMRCSRQRLHLNLWVKVRENWADNARALKELGLE